MGNANKAFIVDRLQQYWLLARFDKPIGIFILLWPTLWALWVAGAGKPDLDLLFIMCAGVVLMRAAGCVINDYADRAIDPKVERTKLRPLATGKVSPKEAVILFIGLCLLAFILVLQLNLMTVLLSFIAAFLAASYPFMKRYTHLPQAYLGIAFGFAVPMAFSAQSNHIPLLAWVMYLAVMLWALVYDTMYAMVDQEDDLLLGVKSTALLFGDWVREIIAVLQLIITALLIVIGQLEQLGGFYYLGVAVATGLSAYQQKLIFHKDRALCFKAFLNSNYFGMAIFLGLALDYWFRLG